MKILTALAAFSLLACSLMTPSARAAEEIKGSWTVTSTNDTGIVRFGLARRWDGNHMSHDDEWPVSEFRGLDYATPGRRDASFVIDRDAGRFDCEGYLKDGDGAGTFRFTATPNYRARMKAIGFEDIDDDKQFSMAFMDVGVEYARSLKALNLKNLDTDKLIAMRIFRATPEFVRGMRAEGLPFDNADQVIAFRVHGATVEWVRQLKRSGLELDENQLIAFRVHGVSPEYIGKVESLGFGKPNPDELIAMRVHGVTPEFIADMKSRGLKDLTIDKLVSLRVHGIR
jgi:hypothetical protein